MSNSISLHNKRKLRNRKSLKKVLWKTKIISFRSSKHIWPNNWRYWGAYCCGSISESIVKQFKNSWTKEAATVVGKLIVEKGVKKGIKNVVFEEVGIFSWKN